MATMASSRGRVWLGPLLVVLVLAGSTVMIGLGVWQLQRLQERRASNVEIRARLAAAPVELSVQTNDLPEYQPVQVRGVYDFSQEIVLRNRAREQSPGVQLLTPLRIDGSDAAVLVDRGWIPYTQAPPSARSIYQTPTGRVTVAGLARASQTRTLFLLPGDPTASPDMPRLDAWFWVNIPQIQGQVPYRLLPFFIEAAPSVDQSVLPISSYDDIDLSDGPHLSYAFQWFSFAAILIVGSLVLWRHRRRQRRTELATQHK
jgi:surfeit locus 1 family protein